MKDLLCKVKCKVIKLIFVRFWYNRQNLEFIYQSLLIDIKTSNSKPID